MAASDAGADRPASVAAGSVPGPQPSGTCSAREQRRVDRTAVDQHQRLVGEDVVETARADRILARIGARDVERRRQPQGLGMVDAPERRMSSALIT